jgi:hypothetical protein
VESPISEIFNLVPAAELRLSPEQAAVYHAIKKCRTSALGGHLSRCNNCQHEQYAFNSCWNRHCPQCQGGEAFEWTQKRMQDLLPVEYFHVVFTLPSEFRELCYRNKKLIYDLLFSASKETLEQIAKQQVGISLGGFAVLHSWNQELQYHPHLHYCIPGGGIKENGSWQKTRKNGKFFLPVRILSAVFKGIFIKELKSLYPKLDLKSSGLENPREFEHLISKAAAKPWTVYAKRPFAGADAVLKYLASYTHRVGISNKRIREVTDTTVSFAARDRNNKGKKKIVTVTKTKFVRSFLLHTLPKSFRRVRHFGFLANRTKSKQLSAIRKILKHQIPEESAIATDSSINASICCPQCKVGQLKLVALFNPHAKVHSRLLNSGIQTLSFCLDPPNTL